jgi:hypothetical protein
MSQLLNRVRPGDLITAEMWNAAVDAINQLLLARPVSSVTIGAMSPRGTTEDPIRPGTILQITGQNFGYSTGRSSVSFEGQFGRVEVNRADLLNGSSDTRLLLMVPLIPTMSEAGMNLTLRVDSGVGQDARPVFVRPITLVPTGDIFLDWRADVTPNPRPNPLQASATGTTRSAEFALRLQTANMPGTLTLAARISDATVAIPSGLVDSIDFMGEDGSVLAGGRVTMGANDTRDIVVRIPNIPPSFAGQTFTLEVSATTPGASSTFSRSFTIGSVVPPSDGTITAQRTGFVVLDADDNIVVDPARGTLDGTTIKLRRNLKLVVMYNLVLTPGSPAEYDLTMAPKQGSALTGWTLQLENTPASVPGPETGRLVQFSATPSGAAPLSTGTIVFRIRRRGADSDWFAEFGVELLP